MYHEFEEQRISKKPVLSMNMPQAAALVYDMAHFEPCASVV